MDGEVARRLRLDEPVLTAADIAVRYRLVADRLIMQGKVFTYTPPSGLRLYPEIQFDAEGPREVIEMILEALGARLLTHDELCEWFYLPREELDGQCVVDVLDDEPHRAVALALDPMAADGAGIPIVELAQSDATTVDS